MTHNIIIGRGEADKVKFGEQGLIYLGKLFVKMGQTSSLSNKIFMDIARSHVVLVAGKRGCLIGDTLVFTDEGYKPISKFDEKKDNVLSFNKEKKEFEWEKAELLKYPIENEKLLKIELKDGRTITLTKEHPLLSSYGKYTFYRRGCDLKINDKIVLPTVVPEIKNDKENLRIARLLGYILADGTINIRKGKFKDGRGYWYNGTKARIRIYNNCREVLIQAKEDLEKEFNITAKRYKRNDCNCEIVETKHQKIVNKFIKLGIPQGNKSGIIRVPKIVFQSSNKFKSEFISSLFDCDGYIHPEGRIIDYASKSRKFLEDLQIILTHIGIESVIRIKKAKCNGKVFDNYRLFITDNTSVENFKKIGFKNKFKQKRLDKHKLNKTKRRKTHYFGKNIVCTRIKSITEIRGVKEVYDLSVDKNHSFIANGVISHNSGKSYTLSVLAEELTLLPEEAKQNVASLMFDTMGIFWTMNYPNEKELSLLQEWQLKPQRLPVRIFVPFGFTKKYDESGIPYTNEFAILPSDLDSADWGLTFGINMVSPEGVLLERTISDLKEKNKEFNIPDIIEEIRVDIKSKKETKDLLESLFLGSQTWGIFSEKATPISKLVEAGKTTILDLSSYNVAGAYNIRGLVISLVSRKLFQERMFHRKKEEVDAVRHGLEYLKYKDKREMPMIWVMVDEAHEFLPREGKTVATDALIQLLREGRQPGISLVLATQQPGEISRDVMTQSDIVISHTITAKADVEALNMIMQTYHLEDIQTYLNQLPHLKGSAIILDDNSERIYPMRVRPKYTWHGGEAPTAVKVQKRL
ncbi:MAG: DUF87 domain-containing protein [Nanoarchaeota archaeon]|nr:DUF87 domain-containing protein [Nanoarchaeota archaeon]